MGSLNSIFLINSIMLGVGLAMDAFSVSIANGLHNPTMNSGVKAKISGTFAGFQFVMPMIGWVLVHYLLESFMQFKVLIPWIALILLGYIGGKMIMEAFTAKECLEEDETKLAEDGVISIHELVVQGIATSIDALSVGFTISDYKWGRAVLCALIIGAVTFIICEIGLRIGIRVGMKLAKKASVLGGAILIFIGIEIFVKGVIL